MIIEACVETLEEALLAEKRGASQIELCADLENEGLTPDFDLIKSVKSALKIPVKVMIRPRAGNFVYSIREIEEMVAAIAFCKEHGIPGVVFGVLTETNEIDIETIRELAKFSAPLQVTIHKAIDLTPDPIEALVMLKTIPEVHTILTSGGAKTALEGRDNLKEMLKLAGDQIQILAAGRITNENLGQVHAALGGRAYHGRKIVGDLQAS